MSDKMKYVKIKRENGTYTDAIPVAVDAANVQFPDGRTLIQATQDFINGTDIAVKFNSTEVYNPGDYIYNNQNLYRVLVKHNANVSWDSWYSITNAEQIVLTDEIKNMIYIGTSQPSNPANKVWINSGLTSTIQIPTELEFENLRDSVAEQYSVKTYSEGEYCINDNKLYRCKADIATAEATFVPSHWQLVNTGDEIYDLKENLGDQLQTLKADMEDEFVRFDAAQNLTAAQKQQARDNIGATTGAVRFDTEQQLTATQQEQARQNIDAVSVEQVNDLKYDLNDYFYGASHSFTVEAEGSHRFNLLLIKGVPYTITNNTNAVTTMRAYKSDGTNTLITGILNTGNSVTFVPNADNYIQLGGYFDGSGLLNVICDFAYTDTILITPELFGAVGDGITNDYTVLQLAINYCISHNLPLYGRAGAIYAVGNTLSISNPPENFYMNLNGATIKALSGYSLTTWTPVLTVTKTNATSTNGYAKLNRFENFIIDTNNVCSGINVDYGYDFSFQNINIIGCKGNAIIINRGGECYFNNIAIKCVHNSGNSTGLLVQSSDYHFTDVIIIDADRAIYNASSSMYTRVHAWNTSGCAGTYYFVHNAGYPILVQCHADTYETAYYRETDRPLMLTSCVYYINSNLYDSSAVPVVFKFATSALSYSGNIKCVNCMFDALRTEVNMTESVHKIQLINCSKKGTINLYNNGTSLTLSNGATDTGLSVNANTITQEGDYIHYYFVLNLTDVDLTGANDKTIGSISNTRFRPKAFMVYPCMFFIDDYATNVISGYITINNSNGVVQIKPNASGTYKKVIADFKEYRPLGLYES